MSKIAYNEMAYQEYLVKKNWKCPTSSTGGHYWVNGIGQNFMCKFCGEIKDMPVPVPEYKYHGGKKKA